MSRCYRRCIVLSPILRMKSYFAFTFGGSHPHGSRRRWARAVTPERRSGKKKKHSSCGFKDGAAGFRHGFRLLKIGGLLIDELSTEDKSQFQENHLCSAWLCVRGGLCVSSFGIRQPARCFGFARLWWFSGRGFRVFARFQHCCKPTEGRWFF